MSEASAGAHGHELVPENPSDGQRFDVCLDFYCPFPNLSARAGVGCRPESVSDSVSEGFNIGWAPRGSNPEPAD